MLQCKYKYIAVCYNFTVLCIVFTAFHFLQYKKTRQNTGPSIAVKMARSFEEERVCDIYLSRIKYWRSINKDNNKCARIKSRKLEILKRQLVNLRVKSPEEENCILKIQKCQIYRDNLLKAIQQLYTEHTNWVGQGKKTKKKIKILPM